MSKLDDIDESTIFHIALDVRNGTADPIDARRLLEYFCECFDKDKPAPYELVRYFRDSFRSYLEGKQKLEPALGLARKKGRPKADEHLRHEMAAAVLRRRMEGYTYQDALAQVSEDFGRGETIIGEAWSANKLEAIILLKLERHPNNSSWTSDEVKQLSKIFENEHWFRGPEKSGNKPA